VPKDFVSLRFSAGKRALKLRVVYIMWSPVATIGSNGKWSLGSYGLRSSSITQTEMTENRKIASLTPVQPSWTKLSFHGSLFRTRFVGTATVGRLSSDNGSNGERPYNVCSLLNAGQRPLSNPSI